MRANRTFFLSHGEPSQKMLGALRGEIANTLKLYNLMNQHGYPVHEILDIYELFGGIENLESLAFLNCDLADAQLEILEEVNLKSAKMVHETVSKRQPQHLFILSWNITLAALFATGIQKNFPTAAKLYVSHENENILAPLYAPASLLLTEALLANEKAIESGIPAWKIIHLPNHYPIDYELVEKNRSYIASKIAVSDKTCIIGAISRLEYGKNIEYALKAAKTLYDQGEDLLFVLKGDFPKETSYPVYREWLKNLLEQLKGEKWFFWDPSPTPFEKIEQVYASIDIFLYLSGSEAGSNVIVESMALGIPTLILDGSTNPSLFKGGALFIENDGTEAQDTIRPFKVPSESDLLKKLGSLVRNPSLRKEWGKLARETAKKRFSPQITIDRLPLIFKAMSAYHSQSENCGKIREEVEALYHEDVKRYGS